MNAFAYQDRPAAETRPEIGTSTAGLTLATPEVAIKAALDEVRELLETSHEATDPAKVAKVRVEAVALADAAKEHELPAEVQFDALELVRRLERGVGVAVRRGQRDGWIARKHATKAAPGLVKALPFFNGNGTLQSESYTMADAADAVFEEALRVGREEGNLARVNICRKIKGQAAGPVTRKQRADAIRGMAVQGYSSPQIADKVGLTGERASETVRKIAREYGIEIAADKVLGRNTRQLDHNRIVEQTVTDLEGTRAVLDMLDLDEITDWSERDYWVTSLRQSIAALRRLHDHMKEMTQP